MKSSFTFSGGNVILVLSGFIVSILIFEDRLVLPVWLQFVGRMHPLFLHLPIVLLLLSLFLEVFRLGKHGTSDHTYQKLASYLLWAGVVTSGIVVVMGVFLGREGGYDSAMLSWHKWTGVGVYFLAVAVYACRTSVWYSPGVAVSAAVFTASTVIVTGVLGASLTHGSDFVLQPVVTSEPALLPEEATAFEHVVRPILQRKCVSCHNPEKAKGKLVLTDSAALQKGGKSGKLLAEGLPQESLLIKRLNLPLTEKKHMPPSGKPQLTREERLLLHHWVQSGAPFGKKVAALHEADTFRMLALAIVKEDFSKGKTYEFPSVSPQTLEVLNSDYRVVRPVALHSPALSVNLYSQDAYTPRALDDLKTVKRQIVSLQLNKMPVTDEHLKYVVRLENLEQLNLNFTAISDEGLQTLPSLKNLRTLSLSGTAVTYDALRRTLPLFQNLNSVSIWDTPLTVSEMKALEKDFPYIRFQGTDFYSALERIKLNPPRLRNKTIVFNDSLVVELFHPVRDVEIRYTTDGSYPDSLDAERFNDRKVLKETTTVKARAFKSEWLSSEVASLTVYRRRHTPDTAILLSRLNRVHTAKGAETFFDRELGSFNANSPAWANNWGGVIGNDLDLLLKYDSVRQVTSVSLNILVEPETFIFPPEVIEVWGGSSEKDLRLLGRTTPEMPSTYSKPFIRLVDCPLQMAQITHMRIIAKPVMKLPAWHKRKERPALLLVDEVLVN